MSVSYPLRNQIPLPRTDPAAFSRVVREGKDLSAASLLRTCVSRPAALTRADYLLMAVGLLFCMLISYVLGHSRTFWEDEMLGWMLLTDPSFHHMVQAWKEGADGGGFAFYLTARGWLHLFGPSEISYRMYSAVCFGLAFIVNWITVRRFYGIWTTGLALFNTYFCATPIALHLVEGRFYGLLMLSTALTVWLAFKLQESARTPAIYYVAVLAAHTLLITSHLLGVVYSFFVLLGMIVLDVLHRRVRPMLYVGVAMTWLLLLLEREAIEASAQVGKPWFWTEKPTVSRLFAPVSGFSGEISVVLGVLMLLALVAVLRRPEGWKATLLAAARRRIDLYVMTAALLLVPEAFLAESMVGPSLFINRYLMPVSIATTFLMAELISLIEWRTLLPVRWRQNQKVQLGLQAGTAAMLAGVMYFWVFVHLPAQIIAIPDYGVQLTAMLPKGVPVLVSDVFTFTELIGRHHDQGVEYLYPLDWEQTTSPLAPRAEVTEYNLMKNWRKVGYFSGSIVDVKQLVETTPKFLVLEWQVMGNIETKPSLGNPLVLRFASTPGYTVKRYAALNCGGKIRIAWLVSHDPKKTGMPPPKYGLDYLPAARP